MKFSNFQLKLLRQITKFYKTVQMTFTRGHKQNAAYLSQTAVSVLFTACLSAMAFTDIPMDYYLSEYYKELQQINCAISKFYNLLEPPYVIPITFYTQFWNYSQMTTEKDRILKTYHDLIHYTNKVIIESPEASDATTATKKLASHMLREILFWIYSQLFCVHNHLLTPQEVEIFELCFPTFTQDLTPNLSQTCLNNHGLCKRWTQPSSQHSLKLHYYFCSLSRNC